MSKRVSGEIAVQIAAILKKNCTGMDDHDDSDCEKCAVMQKSFEDLIGACTRKMEQPVAVLVKKWQVEAAFRSISIASCMLLMCDEIESALSTVRKELEPERMQPAGEANDRS